MRHSAASASITKNQPAIAALKAIYSDLCAAFHSIEPRNASAQKTLSRLVLRCHGCIEQELTPAQHLAQLEGVRFEYLLALRMQGPDPTQAAKYAAVEDFIALIESALAPYKGK